MLYRTCREYIFTTSCFMYNMRFWQSRNDVLGMGKGVPDKCNIHRLTRELIYCGYEFSKWLNVERPKSNMHREMVNSHTVENCTFYWPAFESFMHPLPNSWSPWTIKAYALCLQYLFELRSQKAFRQMAETCICEEGLAHRCKRISLTSHISWCCMYSGFPFSYRICLEWPGWLCLPGSLC